MRIFLTSTLLVMALFLADGKAQSIDSGPEKLGRDITVMADPSLTIPLSLIVREYVRETSNPVTTAFSSTRDHVEAIRKGDEADLFISAKPSWIRTLQQEGLIDVYSRTSLTGNELTLIGSMPPGFEVTPETLHDYFSKLPEEYRFILGDPEYLAEGTYGLESLRRLNLTRELEPHLTLMDNVGEIKKAVLRYDAVSLIFRTDSQLDPTIPAVLNVPDDAHSPIVYEAVVVVGDNMDGAREFLKYLQGKKAQRIFKECGFKDVVVSG